MIKKKIILIGPAFPLRGGISDSNHSLAIALKSLGHDVKIISFSLQYPCFLFPGKSQFDSHAIAPEIDIFSTLNSINPISWLKNSLWLRKQKPDIVITRFWLPFLAPCLGSVLRWSGLKKNILLIGLCDNIVPHEKRLGDSFLTNYFLRANNYFLVMSQSVGNDILSFIPDARLDYHPHPVYDHFGLLLNKKESINKLGLDLKKKYILFFGFIRRYKGLDLLIEAMVSISENIHLIVAGEFYEDELAYKKLVNRLEIKKRVHFYSEFIPQDQVNIYFSACDIVVQPYRSASQSGVAQIAYHFNKPLIVTRIGGLPEIVPDQKVGYVVDVNSVSISKAIQNFYNQKKEDYFISNILQEKKKYSWESMAKKLLKIVKL